MEILSAAQIRNWDLFTIENEPIQSIDLMERASRVFTSWLSKRLVTTESKILVVVSKGNNGGDGLAVARMLHHFGFQLEILICSIQNQSTPDFTQNLERLKFKKIPIHYVYSEESFPALEEFDLIVDGIFGSGLSRPVTGYWGELINYINSLKAVKYAIDIPSGMFCDRITPKSGQVINADYCLSFERPKLGFMFPSNGNYIKNWEIRSIGLHPDYVDSISTDYHYVDYQLIHAYFKNRSKFDHKGTFGHALIIGGSKGMIGAPVLAAKACLRSGAGLVTALIPDCGYEIMQISNPEVMTIQGFGEDQLAIAPDLSKYSCIGIGPGLGQGESVVAFVEEVLSKSQSPMVIDADALNILSRNDSLMEMIPRGSILTPHLGEFDRLFGAQADDLQRIQTLREQASHLNCTIVLKGAHTAIAGMDGLVYFNSTGNPGMATAGSGDVLTGMITSLLARGFEPDRAAIGAVYLHGLAGDIALEKMGMEALIAGDIIRHIGVATKELMQENIK